MDIYKKRRNSLTDKLSNNSVAIIFGSSEKIRNKNMKYKFRQNSNFLYLTGLNEPNCIALLEKKNNKISYILFTQKVEKKDIIWNNNILGQKKIIQYYQPDYAFSSKEFKERFRHFIKGKDYFYFISDHIKYYDKYKNYISNKYEIEKINIININNIVHNLRMTKDDEEIKNINKSHSISTLAHNQIVPYIKEGIKEYELEAIFIKECILNGSSEQSYQPIFASGDNSCILHYNKNNRRMKKNELILIDAGCEYNFYSSDVTRTYPINKNFSKEQQALYEIVLFAQKQAISLCKPGISWNDINNIIINIISQGLKDLKILAGDINNIIERKQYKNFYMHSPGHWMGLDVHDVGEYKNEENQCVHFRENMYISIEPGIYVNRCNLDVPEKWRGIGIRIEDNLLITRYSYKVLSNNIPKEILDIENAMR